MNINYFDKCKTTDQVKKKYLKLAKEFHPDVNKEKEATAVFQEIQKQRDKKVREIMRADGKSDLDIEDLLNSFGTENFTDNLLSAVDYFKKQMEDQGIDVSKPPTPKTFATVFNSVLKTLTGEVESKEENKKLPGK